MSLINQDPNRLDNNEQYISVCYQLCLNDRVSRVLLQSFLLSFWLTYGKENNHDKYFMDSGYLCISLAYPHMAAQGWAYPLIVLPVFTSWISKTLSIGLPWVSISMKMSPKNICQLLSPIGFHMEHCGLDITRPFCFSLWYWVCGAWFFLAFIQFLGRRKEMPS